MNAESLESISNPTNKQSVCGSSSDIGDELGVEESIAAVLHIGDRAEAGGGDEDEHEREEEFDQVRGRGICRWGCNRCIFLQL